ncbi:hypothetical protein B0H12DRAFT_1304696 [Mycena haematopus]|nr:hypothetical protein B0H12DRAFT_1304696 [Mycena haematopus]
MLMGNAEFSDFDSLVLLNPNPSFDFMIRSYINGTNCDPRSVIPTPWTSRALADLPLSALATKKKYKPVHRKVRPVPTYMPNPEAQFFREIPPPNLTDLPLHPRNYRELPFGSRVTLPRLESMLARIAPGTLTKQETDLLAFVVVARESAFAFDYSEKGCFSREYYPDYEIPTIEHTHGSAHLSRYLTQLLKMSARSFSTMKPLVVLSLQYQVIVPLCSQWLRSLDLIRRCVL